MNRTILSNQSFPKQGLAPPRIAPVIIPGGATKPIVAIEASVGIKSLFKNSWPLSYTNIRVVPTLKNFPFFCSIYRETQHPHTDILYQ